MSLTFCIWHQAYWWEAITAKVAGGNNGPKWIPMDWGLCDCMWLIGPRAPCAMAATRTSEVIVQRSSVRVWTLMSWGLWISASSARFPCRESTCQAPQVLKLLVKSTEDMEEDAQLWKGKTRWNALSRKPDKPEAKLEKLWMFDFARENTNFI